LRRGRVNPGTRPLCFVYPDSVRSVRARPPVAVQAAHLLKRRIFSLSCLMRPDHHHQILRHRWSSRCKRALRTGNEVLHCC
jgi:hypothetical protein